MTLKPQNLCLLLVTCAFSATPVWAEYAAGGIEEAQALPKVITDTKAPISPETMAAVIAKVKANPALTNALIQANPRYKALLGLGENSAPAPLANVASGAEAPPVAFTPAPRHSPASKESVRLNETLLQVRNILGGAEPQFATSAPSADRNDQAFAQQNIPDTNRFGEPLTISEAATPASGRRLLGGLDPQNSRRERSAEILELKRKILLQKERRFARLSNSNGGASLQASLEFNRRVRGAVGPQGDGRGFQLAMRDISETAEPRPAPNDSIRRRKIIGGENRVAKPVSATEETDLISHKYLYSTAVIKEGAEGGGGIGEAIKQSVSQSIAKPQTAGPLEPRLR